jgi:selenocysteine lyase/cysteine desulfurase
VRLLGLSSNEVLQFRDDVVRGDKRHVPGAVRASAGINTSAADIDRLLSAVETIASRRKPPVSYSQDLASGDFNPEILS